jgi:CBS domain-containing protein
VAYKAKLLLCDVASVGPEETVQEVARLMRRRHIGSVVVVENGEIIGVFTERDIANKIAPEAVDVTRAKVSQFMTPKPFTVDREEPLEKVFELLSRRRFRHVPIVDGKKPVGMVSLSDFAGVLREVFDEEKYLQYFVSYIEQREN